MNAMYITINLFPLLTINVFPLIMFSTAIGAIIARLLSKLLFGVQGNMALGIVGAFFGTAVAMNYYGIEGLFGFGSTEFRSVSMLIAAVIGAIILLFLDHLSKGKSSKPESDKAQK